LFTIGLLTNLPLLGTVVLTVGLQIGVLYVPALRPVFKTVPLTADELGLCLLLSMVVPVAVEVEKWILRRRGEAGEAPSE
jgi:Ca2+-transporting ATPase